MICCRLVSLFRDIEAVQSENSEEIISKLIQCSQDWAVFVKYGTTLVFTDLAAAYNDVVTMFTKPAKSQGDDFPSTW